MFVDQNARAPVPSYAPVNPTAANAPFFLYNRNCLLDAGLSNRPLLYVCMPLLFVVVVNCPALILLLPLAASAFGFAIVIVVVIGAVIPAVRSTGLLVALLDADEAALLLEPLC